MAQSIPSPGNIITGYPDDGEASAPSASWVGIDMAWFDDFRDPGSNLTGTVTSAGGVLTVPHAKPDATQDLRDCALYTGPLAGLAAALGTTEAAILDGSVTVSVRCSDMAVANNNSVGVALCLLDRTAALGGALYGVGTGVTRLNGKEGGGLVHHTANTNTPNLTAATGDFVTGYMRCVEEGGINHIDAGSYFFRRDDNNVPALHGCQEFDQTTLSMGTTSHVGLAIYFENSNVLLNGTYSFKMEIAAIPTSELTMTPGSIITGYPGSGSGTPTPTTKDLSSGSILRDPGSYLTPDNRTASEVVTNTNGSASSINIADMAMIDLEGETVDGTYIWDLTRNNPGSLDKMGLLLGFYDSANTDRNILGGMFETATNRTVNTSTAATLVADTQSTLTRVRVSVDLRTDGSGNRVIGPGTLAAYNGTTLLALYTMGGTHTITGTLQKACGVRRGTAGAPAGDVEYELTEERRDP